MDRTVTAVLQGLILGLHKTGSIDEDAFVQILDEIEDIATTLDVEADVQKFTDAVRQQVELD